jgi:hypothetical protein
MTSSATRTVMTGNTADHEVMDAVTEVAELLFGDGADELIRKMNPTQSDLAAQKRQKRQAQIGLASNVVGIGAGLAGTAEAYNKFKSARGKTKATKIPKGEGGKFAAAGKKIGGSFKRVGGKRAAVIGAGGLLGLQVANVAGDAVANRVLSREAKKDHVKKSKNEYATSVDLPSVSRGKLAVVTGQKAKKAADKVKEQVQKNVDIVWEGEFSKFDMDKRQVFGWASIVEMNGEPVVDLQGDYIPPEEMEKAAYEYVQKSRKGGDMHRREGEQAFHASEMIESFIVTPEKIEKMGLPAGSLPTGWWVGYQVHDDDTWNLVKSGRRTGFSIHGRGKRKET